MRIMERLQFYFKRQMLLCQNLWRSTDSAHHPLIPTTVISRV